MLGGCSQDDFLPADDGNAPDGTATRNTVTLSFQLAGNTSSATRAEYTDEEMMVEEGNVNSLTYAIFQGSFCKKYETINLSGETYQTGSNNNIYTLTGLDTDWFDETTEIFAVANAPESMRDKLCAQTLEAVTLKITIDDAIIQQAVTDSIEWRARKEMYDTFIKNQLQNSQYPKDGKLHYQPASETNHTSIKYTLTNDTKFTDYDELAAKRKSTTDAITLAMYNAIIEDLSCRIELYGNKKTYTGKIATYTEAENNAGGDSYHAIANSLFADPDLLRYVLWKEYIYEKDLNKTAASNPSRLIEAPLMSGYLALSDNVGSVITVPVEHVYSRIWFKFGFTGVGDELANEKPYIDITDIKVEGLTNKTLLFDVSGVTADIENNIIADIQKDPEETPESQQQSPFFGYLANSGQQHYSNNSNNVIEVLRYYPGQPNYNTVCRYPLQTGTNDFDTNNARRYYIYSFSRRGTKLEENPKITVFYDFTEKGKTEINSKTAWAYLYDETHSNGKLHHGLLRNYTYGVNCQINANTLGLTLQVTSHDWYAHTINDIPTFE